jgi:hypothetical protein
MTTRTKMTTTSEMTTEISRTIMTETRSGTSGLEVYIRSEGELDHKGQEEEKERGLHG